MVGATSSAVVAAAGDITTIAGSLGEGPALGVAQQPSGLALRGTSLFVSDPRRNVIRVIDLSTGVERVTAGTGSPGSAGDGGPARAAGLIAPEGIDVDSAANLFVADTGSNEIRKIDPSGRITTVAGRAEYGHFGGGGGSATQANLSFPMDVAVDGAGTLYIAESFGSDFNYDFHVTLDESVAPIEYNYRTKAEHEQAGVSGLQGEQPGQSWFLRDGDTVFHTYSNHARGAEMTGGSYYYLDLTALGRQEAWEEPKGRAVDARGAIPDFSS